MNVLVAGIGNIFLGDDGFGVEVAARLAGVDVPDGVRVVDFGIRGVHLAYELLDGYDALVLIDAVPMGEEPGTVAIIEPDLAPSGPAEGDDDGDGGDPGLGPTMDAHSMSPAVVLALLASLGGHVDRVLVVGCEPSVIEEGIGLSAPVASAVDRAVEAVLEVGAELSIPSKERSRA
jgi:hydrogenase maturation protease